jgi:DNA-binding MarR family transcriptional regulator
VKKNLTQEKAEKLIEVALALRLIARIRSRQDRRYWLYKLTTEQIDKLNRIEKGGAEVYRLIQLQAANPADHEAGLNEQNKHWYRNIVPGMLLRHNEEFHREKAKLSKLKYLLSAIALFGIVTGTTVAVSFAAAGAAKAVTLSDGGK